MKANYQVKPKWSSLFKCDQYFSELHIQAFKLVMTIQHPKFSFFIINELLCREMLRIHSAIVDGCFQNDDNNNDNNRNKRFLVHKK